jgi:hypothetical protein
MYRSLMHVSMHRLPFFQLSRRLGGGDGQVSESWDGMVLTEARRSLRRG